MSLLVESMSFLYPSHSRLWAQENDTCWDHFSLCRQVKFNSKFIDGKTHISERFITSSDEILCNSLHPPTVAVSATEVTAWLRRRQTWFTSRTNCRIYGTARLRRNVVCFLPSACRFIRCVGCNEIKCQSHTIGDRRLVLDNSMHCLRTWLFP
jgi:hypothetical protein